MMHEIVRDWEILSTGPGGLAMGLQETLRRTCAPNTTHAAPRSAPAAHAPAQSLSTPVQGTGGVSVCSGGRRGAAAMGRGRCEARAAPLWELAPPQLSSPPSRTANKHQPPNRTYVCTRNSQDGLERVASQGGAGARRTRCPGEGRCRGITRARAHALHSQA